MSYKAGIVSAITALKDREGSSSIAIKKHMHIGLPRNFEWMNATFLAALKKMVADGDLVQNKDSYKLSLDFKKKCPGFYEKELEKYNQLDEGFSVEGLRQRIDGIPHNLVRIVLERTYFLCGSKNISDELVQCVLGYFPEGASLEFDGGRRLREDSTAFMLHFACANKYCPGSVIETLLAKNPAALRHLACVDGRFIDFEDFEQIEHAGLPLHYYLAREANLISILSDLWSTNILSP